MFAFAMSSYSWASILQGLFTLLLASIVYHLLTGVYNLYLHPLSKYPGPKIAAFTEWWKTYVEVYRHESLVERLFELHSLHGESQYKICTVVLTYW